MIIFVLINEYKGSLLAAIIVSCLLSGLLAILFLVIIVFSINLNYKWILDHIASVNKYSTLENNGKNEIDESSLGYKKRNLYNEYQVNLENLLFVLIFILAFDLKTNSKK